METRLRDSAISLNGSNSFFDRSKLPPTARGQCDEFVKSSVPERTISTVAFQGYCSYTLRATSRDGREDEDLIIQFRPKAHAIPIEIANAACEVYGSLAPATRQLGEIPELGLTAYSIAKITGISLLELRETTRQQPPSQIRVFRERAIKDFAHIQALAYHRGLFHASNNDQRLRTGLVGNSLRQRLKLMQSSLPARFRPILTLLLADLDAIESCLPWVLSHGDLIPANIMVCPASGKLQGLIDWAEAEYLPFGVGIYGLEELLGEQRPQTSTFDYYLEAAQLRKLFWSELLVNCPELRRTPEQVLLIKKAQVLGIFLWHGIAFDNGALNRACEVGRDDEEIAKLDAFLSSAPESLWRKSRGEDSRKAFTSPLRFLRGLFPRRTAAIGYV